MKPLPFPEANSRLLKPAGSTDEECGPLPCYKDGRYIISKWGLSWRERLRMLWQGHVWLWVWGETTQPPVSIETKDAFVQKLPWWRSWLIRRSILRGVKAAFAKTPPSQRSASGPA